jgi:hypothetical protein
VRRASSERQEVDEEDVDREQRQRGPICALITPFWSLSSSSAAGTMLKLAAIGVISVPQKPASMPIAPITAGSPP